MSITCTHYIHKPVALPFTTVLLVLFVYTTRNTLQCMLCIHLVIWLKIVQQQLQSGSTVFCQLNRMIFYFNIKCSKTKKNSFVHFYWGLLKIDCFLNRQFNQINASNSAAAHMCPPYLIQKITHKARTFNSLYGGNFIQFQALSYFIDS